MTTYSGKPKSSESGIRQQKRYPAYKDSGVEWLGEIPAHWAAKRLRFVLETSISKQEVRDFDPETEVSFVPMEAVREYGGIDLDSTKALSEVAEGYTYFRNGDVIVAKITPCFENGKGAMATGLRNDVGFGTTELHVLRTSSHVNPRFLLYLTFSDHFRRIGTSSMYGAGGQKRISDDFIRDFRHPVPSLPEQRAIAAFLDRETARIDALVAKKERLIELLQEKRSALISRAVTQGLNPDVPMKASGVEWLGEVPAHWEVKRLKFSAHLVAGQSPPSVDVYDLPGGLPFLQGNAEFGLVKPTPKLACDTATKRACAGDILLSVRAPVGAMNIADQAYGIGRGLCAIQPFSEIDDDFFYYMLLSERRWLHRNASGSTYDAVTAGDVGDLSTLLPEAHEQRVIAGFLDRETRKIDALVGKVRKAIDLLKEIRQALISAAVTGKIDVRQEAA